jgi:hypothetical protein
VNPRNARPCSRQSASPSDHPRPRRGREADCSCRRGEICRYLPLPHHAEISARGGVSLETSTLLRGLGRGGGATDSRHPRSGRRRPASSTMSRCRFWTYRRGLFLPHVRCGSLIAALRGRADDANDHDGGSAEDAGAGAVTSTGPRLQANPG